MVAGGTNQPEKDFLFQGPVVDLSGATAMTSLRMRDCNLLFADAPGADLEDGTFAVPPNLQVVTTALKNLAFYPSSLYNDVCATAPCCCRRLGRGPRRWAHLQVILDSYVYV